MLQEEVIQLNRNQRIVVLVGVAIVLTIIMFPPWNQIAGTNNNPTEVFAGFRLLFSVDGSLYYRISFPLLFGELLAATLATSGLILYFKNPN